MIVCLACGTVLESKFRHDYQTCSCPNGTMIDGGTDYCRAGGRDLSLVAMCKDKKDGEKKYKAWKKKHE